MSAPADMGGMERHLPPLPPLRTGSNKSASPGERPCCTTALPCALAGCACAWVVAHAAPHGPGVPLDRQSNPACFAFAHCGAHRAILLRRAAPAPPLPSPSPQTLPLRSRRASCWAVPPCTACSEYSTLCSTRTALCGSQCTPICTREARTIQSPCTLGPPRPVVEVESHAESESMARRRRCGAVATLLRRACRRSRPPAQCPEISLLSCPSATTSFVGLVDLNFVARAAGKPHALHSALMPSRSAWGTTFC